MIPRSGSDEIKRTSIVDTVTERLRAEILSGQIQPAERIRVSDLGQRFGVSHIPIREALRRLESEGLVVTSPQRATLAAGVALDHLADLYDLRLIIETQLARRAVERMSDEDVENIRNALASLEDSALDADSAEFWDHHRAFHWAMLAPAGNAWSQRILEQLWQSAERYVRLFVSTFGSVDDAMREHREMVEACSARDVELITTLVRSHLKRTETTVREGYLRMRKSAESPSGEVLETAREPV